MHARLSDIDPQAAERIEPNDPQRIQRALEVHELTGKTLTECQNNKVVPNLKTLKIVVTPPDRAVLHERIAQRFDWMLTHGLIDEVASLMSEPQVHEDLPSMRSVA